MFQNGCPTLRLHCEYDRGLGNHHVGDWRAVEELV